MKTEAFIAKYSEAIIQKEAAVFVGAGFSSPCGFLNWKELLRPIAEELDLDIEKEEKDLIALAQYYYNEKRNRGDINQLIVDNYHKNVTVTENHKILAKLPISTFWTTNYDELLELALKGAGKDFDAKITAGSFTSSVKNKDATIFKMHGDVKLPDDTILIKDDYENFYETRKLFITALRGDLVSKTFLFLGYSFKDPDLDYILSRIRILVGDNKRSHYCIMREINQNDFTDIKEYDYELKKQKFKISDLKRFGINTVLIKEYSEIPEILKQIESRIKLKNVFMSGSADSYGVIGDVEAIEFITCLSKALSKEGFKIISGFGLGVGSHVINGVLENIFSTNYQHLDEHLILRPFPQIKLASEKRKELWTKYRKEMINHAGIAIFLFGNKTVDGEIVEAEGILDEFEIAKEQGLFLIPIGSTGFVAEKLWKILDDSFDVYYSKYPHLKPDFKILNDANLSTKEIINTIIKIVKQISR